MTFYFNLQIYLILNFQREWHHVLARRIKVEVHSPDPVFKGRLEGSITIPVEEFDMLDYVSNYDYPVSLIE